MLTRGIGSPTDLITLCVELMTPSISNTQTAPQTVKPLGHIIDSYLTKKNGVERSNALVASKMKQFDDKKQLYESMQLQTEKEIDPLKKKMLEALGRKLETELVKMTQTAESAAPSMTSTKTYEDYDREAQSFEDNIHDNSADEEVEVSTDEEVDD